MNTAEKGRRYEWAYKRKLLAEGARLVYRSAASKGPFDLIAWLSDTFMPCGYQLKDQRNFTCQRANRLLNDLTINYPEVIPYVVHRRRRRTRTLPDGTVEVTTEKEFCEH